MLLREDTVLKKITDHINKEGKGVIVFVNQDHETKPILNKINHLKKSQESGKNHKPYKAMDLKDYGVGAQILYSLNVSKIKLLTSNTKKIKRVGMAGYGLEIVEYIKI